MGFKSQHTGAAYLEQTAQTLLTTAVRDCLSTGVTFSRASLHKPIPQKNHFFAKNYFSALQQGRPAHGALRQQQARNKTRISLTNIVMEKPFSYNSVHIKEVRESLIVFFVWDPSCLFDIRGITCWIIQAQKASLGLGKIKKKKNRNIGIYLYTAEKMEDKNIYRKRFRCMNAAQGNFKNLMRKLLSYRGFDVNPVSQSSCAYNEFEVA